MIDDCFQCEEIAVKYKFIRKHISLILNRDSLYNEFLFNFLQYFLRITLSEEARTWANELLLGNDIAQNKKHYIKNTLYRIFSNKEHFKGLIGEYILCFYYKNIVDDFLDEHGPKPRSSAEPGIDYIVFVGREDRLDSIKFIVWETKTTKNTAAARASEIYDFFSINGSFDENIDCEIHAIQDRYKEREESNLKTVVKNMTRYVLDCEDKLNIGACIVLNDDRTRTDTLNSFENCIQELTKEQRNVTIIFFELLKRVMDDLEEQIWNKL